MHVYSSLNFVQLENPRRRPNWPSFLRYASLDRAGRADQGERPSREEEMPRFPFRCLGRIWNSALLSSATHRGVKEGKAHTESVLRNRAELAGGMARMARWMVEQWEELVFGNYAVKSVLCARGIC
jgi:hypothetical protein